MQPTALILNCALKEPDRPGGPAALLAKVHDLLAVQDVLCEEVRVADFWVPIEDLTYDGEQDEWPRLLQKIEAFDILVLATPVWSGPQSTLAGLLLERLEEGYAERLDRYDLPFLGKVAGVLVLGNGGAARGTGAAALFGLARLGCTVPPTADCYWEPPQVPEASASYVEPNGGVRLYTNRRARHLAMHCAHMARVLRRRPLPVTEW